MVCNRSLTSWPLAGSLLLVVAILLVACSEQPEPTDNPSLAEKDPNAVPIGDIMATIYTYPTGNFDPRWVESARASDAKLRTALPKGEHVHLGRNKSLDPSRFTPLGPQPLLDNGERFSGRISDIVVSAQPLIAGDSNSYRAFISTPGGGIWRSSNCCSGATTFAPVTDLPGISSIAVGDLEIDPNDPQVIYAGTGDLRYGSWSFGALGLLKSSDGGDNWRVLGSDVFVPNYPASLSAFSQYQAISKVEVDPNQSRNLIVGSKTGLFLSYDAGENWVGPCLSNEFGPNSSNPHRQDSTGLLALDFAGSTVLYLAIGTRGSATPVQPDLDRNGANGIYRAAMPSSGCPQNWQRVSRADNGWPEQLGNGAPFGPIGRIELAAAPNQPNVIYAEAISAQDFSIYGIWRSTDAGNSWQQRDSDGSFAGCEPGQQNWYNAGISVSPAHSDDLLLSAYWTYRSTNGGLSFRNLNCNNNVANVHIDQHAIAFVGADPNRLLIGNDGGLFYSDDASSFQPRFVPVNDSISSIEFYAGDISANFATANSRTIIGGAQDNGTSVLIQSGQVGPAPWAHIHGGDGISARIEPVFGNRVYMSTQRGRISLSTNGASAAEQSANGPWSAGQQEGERKSFLMRFDLYRYGDRQVADSGCAGAQGCDHLIAGTYRVWESTNGAIGATEAQRWQAISPDLTKNNLIVAGDNRSVIQAIRFSVPTRRIAMVGTLDGNLWYGFGLGTGSPSWRNLTDNNSVLPNRPILDVATDPLVPSIGYAAVAGFGANTPGTPGHVYQVRCNADCSSFSWRDVSGNLPDVPVNAVMVNPWIPTQVFAGSDWGLYYTDNVEAAQPVWRAFLGLPRAMIWEMAIDRGFSTLAVFTRSRGAWVWPLPRQLPDSGPIDEPQISRFNLPAPTPPNASCPAGFFVASVTDGPGAGLSPGIFGMELLLDDPGSRLLAGGLNFGGLIDAGQVGFAGFNFTNPANEDQRLNISLRGSPSSAADGQLMARVKIVRQDTSSSETVFDSVGEISLAQASVASLIVAPGFYVATVAPEGAGADEVGGRPEGQFFFELTTSFVDRPGGGFQGGAVVGGYHAEHPFGGISGFAAFCLANPHATSIRVLSQPSYGPSGAQDLRLRLQDDQQRQLLALPQD